MATECPVRKISLGPIRPRMYRWGLNMTGMRAGLRLVRAGVLAIGVLSSATTAAAQQPATAPANHDQASVTQGGSGATPADTVGEQSVPMTRQGSGTAWLPDASPMYAVHRMQGAWELMMHGNSFVQYLEDETPRGTHQVGSINWLMAMARRPAGAGRIGLNAMFSLEPWTIRGCGYPDLLASGERCDGQAIVDRQHPHDLFMELAASYERPLTRQLAIQIYGGPSGEPALGPVAYPHRVSAFANPLAPISHHWLDATHITFGVVTAGLYGRRWKAEGSVFNGREPDEDRLNVDLGALDSYSGRLWVLPSDRLALQVSAGHLREAESADEEGGPRPDVDRVTASVTYHRMLENGGVWASTAAWGRNRESGRSTDFVLGETTLTVRDRDSWFGRLEIGKKPAHDLDLHELNDAFTVAKAQVGYVRFVETGTALRAGVGVTASVGVLPGALRDLYGGRTALGFGLFLTIRPAAMVMSAADPHAGHQMP